MPYVDVRKDGVKREVVRQYRGEYGYFYLILTCGHHMQRSWPHKETYRRWQWCSECKRESKEN